MRLLFILLIFIGTTTVKAQKFYSSYIVDLPYGQEIQAGDLRVVFEELISESRCPKAVTCVRSGEAVIEICVFRGEDLLEKKKLVFNAEGVITDENNLIYTDENIRLMGIALRPYPKGNTKILDKDYIMELKVN